MEILHPRLQGGELATVVGQAGATLVEQDQPETRSQLKVEVPPSRILPRVDEVGHVVGHVDQIGFSVTYDLVRDRDSATPRILDLRRRHARHCLREQSWRQPADMSADRSRASTHARRVAKGCHSDITRIRREPPDLRQVVPARTPHHPASPPAPADRPPVSLAARPGRPHRGWMRAARRCRRRETCEARPAIPPA
jgi:hypothetical protein